MHITYISWAPHCSRSDSTARELGGTSHMVYWGWLGSHPATIGLKYAGQTIKTWGVLARERPDAVFVMTPPPVAIIAVYLFCAWRRIPFVVDAHSAAFGKRWRLFQGLQFWLCRRAATTIVSNAHLAEVVGANGGRTTIVPDVPIEFEGAAAAPSPVNGFTVVCVTSFDRDEPIDAMLEAARRLPNIPFLMTGNPAKARLRTGELPTNLRLTGFLDTATYGALLMHAGVVMALTTDDHTMQRGAYESIYQGTPVIVSDFPILQQAFDEGAVLVDNSPESIVRAVQRVHDSLTEYKEAAQRLRARKQERWTRTKEAILETLRA